MSFLLIFIQIWYYRIFLNIIIKTFWKPIIWFKTPKNVRIYLASNPDVRLIRFCFFLLHFIFAFFLSGFSSWSVDQRAGRVSGQSHRFRHTSKRKCCYQFLKIFKNPKVYFWSWQKSTSVFFPWFPGMPCGSLEDWTIGCVRW